MVIRIEGCSFCITLRMFFLQNIITFLIAIWLGLFLTRFFTWLLYSADLIIDRDRGLFSLQSPHWVERTAAQLWAEVLRGERGASQPSALPHLREHGYQTGEPETQGNNSDSIKSFLTKPSKLWFSLWFLSLLEHTVSHRGQAVFVSVRDPAAEDLSQRLWETGRGLQESGASTYVPRSLFQSICI